MLVDRLEQFLREAEGYDASTLAMQAHKLTSAAGFLGFAKLSAIFADVERQVSAGDMTAQLMQEAVATAVETIDAIAPTRVRQAV